MKYKDIKGVPDFEAFELCSRRAKYCLLIPIINEGERIKAELFRAKEAEIDSLCDIIICDGGSTDGSTKLDNLRQSGVNTLLVKTGKGKQGAQLRMGFYWALQRGYEGFITIDGNNKDSIEDVPAFLQKLDEGYDFVQGSRFIKGGKAVNTPLSRYIAVRVLHAPVISLTAGKRYTDTTNAFRAHSRRYITHPSLNIFRDVFSGYELLAFLSTEANRLALRSCELPVTRAYPKGEKTPTKISGIKGNLGLLDVLYKNFKGEFRDKRF